MKPMTILLATLADATRLRVIRLLLREELCVCELVDALRIPQYKMSRHLGTLRAVGLVEARRNGRWMYYRPGRRYPRVRLRLRSSPRKGDFHMDVRRQWLHIVQDFRMLPVFVVVSMAVGIAFAEFYR